jgi:hypothetical protein
MIPIKRGTARRLGLKRPELRTAREARDLEQMQNMINALACRIKAIDYAGGVLFG